MKMLYQIANRLRQYYAKNKLIFLLFLVGCALNSIMFAYIYGNVALDIFNRYPNFKESARSYTVTFTDDVQEAAIRSLAEDSRVETAFPYIRYRADVDGIHMYICAHENGKPIVDPVAHLRREIMSGTVDFSTAYQVVVPSATGYGVGETVVLEDKAFEVVGVHSFFDGYYIPYETYISMGLLQKTTHLQITVKEMPDVKNDANLRKLMALFPGQEIERELDSALWFLGRIADGDVGRLCICYLFVAIAFAFLLCYLTDSLMQETLLSRLVGATKETVLVTVFWESVILTAGANALGLLIHWLFYEPFFSKLNVSPDLRYAPGDYLTIYLLMFLICLLVTVLFVLRYLKLSPMAARRKHGS